MRNAPAIRSRLVPSSTADQRFRLLVLPSTPFACRRFRRPRLEIALEAAMQSNAPQGVIGNVAVDRVRDTPSTARSSTVSTVPPPERDDAQVANRPLYVAIGVNLEGERDVLTNDHHDQLHKEPTDPLCDLQGQGRHEVGSDWSDGSTSVGRTLVYLGRGGGWAWRSCRPAQ
jgi:hypothetical protein